MTPMSPVSPSVPEVPGDALAGCVPLQFKGGTHHRRPAVGADPVPRLRRGHDPSDTEQLAPASKYRTEIAHGDNRRRATMNTAAPEHRAARDAAIHTARTAGDSVPDIAARHGLSTWRVWQILDPEYLTKQRARQRRRRKGVVAE